MGDKVLVNFRLDSEQKQAWEGYVEESDEHINMSGLIRTAVSKEMNQDLSGQAVESPALSSDVEEIKEGIESLKSEVQWLTKQQRSDEVTADVAEQLNADLKELPPSPVSEVPAEVDDETAFRQREAAYQIIQPQSEDDEKTPQTAQAFASKYGVNENDIRDAIEELKNDFIPIVEVEIDGTIHYFRRE